MKNSDLAQKIKQLRTRKGFSQEELAEKTQLSLRTIQRIENGETEPRGDTMKRLANALDVGPDELIDWTEQEDSGYLVILNLSALSFLVFPLLNIIIPMALWMLKKDKIRYIDDTGKRILNFQITWSLIIFVVFMLAITGTIAHISPFKGIGGPEVAILSIPVFYLFNGVMVLINSYRSYHSKKVVYQPAVPFLR